MRNIPNRLHDGNDDDGDDYKEKGEERVGWGLLFWQSVLETIVLSHANLCSPEKKRIQLRWNEVRLTKIDG